MELQFILHAMKHVDNLGQDEVLLQQLVQTVLQNLENEQFGVEELSEQIGMSRSHLHRKLKLLKGQSVSQFIREIRLEEAMKLLQNDVATAAEIAYRVGFGSSSYFHKCFHDHFGYPPGDIKKRTLEGNGNIANPTPILEETPTTQEDRPVSTLHDTLPQKTSQRKVLSWKMLLPAALALPLIFFAVFYFSPTNPGSGTTPPKSIAVLPLDNLTGDAEQDYLAAGMHDALIGELGKINGLRVISKTSTLRYSEQRNMLMQEIAQELNVEVIVEGSVLVSGDSLRIQIQLIQPFPEERHIFAQEYYQDIRQVLAMQNTVIRDIARRIEVNLTPQEEAQLASTRTVNPETYKAYLRGMYYLQKPTEEDRKKGMAYLLQAVDNDPADPLAYAGLAMGYINMGHSTSLSSDALIKAKAAAFQAIRLDSTLIEAHIALGEVYFYFEWDWESAERTFQYVNEVNPNMAMNHYNYAWYLHLMGRKEEATAEHELAAQLDPWGPKNTAWLGWLYADYGEYQRAEEIARKVLAIDSTYDVAYSTLGLIKIKQERYDEAIKIYKQLVAIYPHYNWLLGSAYAKAGQISEARKILTDLEQLPPSPYTAFRLAVLYASLGEHDKAFEWLRYKPHHAWVPGFRVMPDFSSLHNDPRFNELLEEMNLPPVPTPSEASL